MTPAQRDRLREVLLGAMQLAPPEREAFVLQACTGDEWVRLEAERLLRHCDDASAFLSSPAVDVAEALGFARAGKDSAETLPDRIWGCRILRVLGRGGMGVVYEAVQDQPRRPVAIKVLHRAFASAAPRMSAFEAEVLARLTHPGIAHIYAAGEHRENRECLPFLVMELVRDARSIVRHAAEQGLSTRERVELVIQACDAVAHAHQRGIVHRDLKAGNVLVGGDGRVKVIDFGLARVTDSDLTLTAQLGDSIWGTIASMSPEQLAGRPHDVDARTDIYSLGVILYELLTGRPPFDVRGLSAAEAMQTVLRADPPHPASLEPNLRADVAAITLKAMAKDREKRYQWVGALAQDLRDHLAGRPVSARTPGPWQRFARWIGRHPVAATAAACAGIAALVLAATLLSVHVLARRPAYILLDEDGRLATLQSVAGHTLHAWRDGIPGAIVEAEMTDRPAQFGGGRVAVIVRDVKSTHPDAAGHVAIYEAARPESAIWTTVAAPLPRPPGYEDRSEIRITCGPTLLADIFPESPGKEIATVQGLWPYSPVCIRIFDLAGRELYALWHDGGLTHLVWRPDRRHLVAAGLSSEARWDERGYPWAGGAYPYIVLAIEPRLGHVGRPWAIEDDRLRDPTVRWCRWLGPADRLGSLPSFVLRLDAQSLVSGVPFLNAVMLVERADRSFAELRFGLDPEGREVRRWTSDAYKAGVRAGELPDADDYQLLDITELPPRLADAPAAPARGS